ncbi:MAG: PAS domain-containing protein [Pseudomonadota bacterium]
MKHTTSQTLYSYWNEVRDGRPAPRRFDIEPARISHILSSTLILERLDFETYRFRLAGTDVCDIFGYELRGEEFFPLWDEEGDRISFEKALSAITRHCRLGVFEFAGEAPSGETITCEMLLMPLVHTNDQVDRCLGAISAAYSETRFNSEPLTNHRLLSSRMITPDANLEQYVTPTEPQGPQAPAPFTADIRSARIVRSDRRQFRVYDGGLSD